MEHINDLLKECHSSSESTKTVLKTMPSKNLMNQLWAKMTKVWGYKLTSVFGETPPMEWAEVLRGMTGQMISHGYNRMIESDMEWPPNAMDFKRLCKPTAEDLGLVGIEKAFKQAVGNDTNKTPEVIYTLREMGEEAFLMRREVTEKASKRFSGWYSKTIAHVLSGGKLPKPELKIEDKPVMTPNKEGQAKIQAIMAMINE